VLDGTGVIVSDASKGEPTEYAPVSAALLLARADYCTGHREMCAAMVGGVVEALKFIREDRDGAIAIMKAHFPGFDDKVMEAAYVMLRDMTPDPPATKPAELENGDNMNIAAGFMKEDEKLSRYDTLIDNSFIK
jgi:ABC-type nitrate/sulfonate/bicarbonate transport system substrate-binding protein